MKKIIFAFVFITLVGFIAILVDITNFGTTIIHGEENQQYMEKIFREDTEVQTKLGKIQKYKIMRIGIFEGYPPDEQGYDYYTLKVNGENSSAFLYIKLYKNKNGEIEKYKMEIDE